MFNRVIKAALFGIGTVVVLSVLLAFVGGESYNYIYPGIDTKFASGFSEEAFDQVKTGMSFEEVERLLGAPLGKTTARDGTYTWWYTEDGKCRWGDFAWLGREVMFLDKRVVDVVRHIYYD